MSHYSATRSTPHAIYPPARDASPTATFFDELSLKFLTVRGFRKIITSLPTDVCRRLVGPKCIVQMQCVVRVVGFLTSFNYRANSACSDTLEDTPAVQQPTDKQSVRGLLHIGTVGQRLISGRYTALVPSANSLLNGDSTPAALTALTA